MSEKRGKSTGPDICREYKLLAQTAYSLEELRIIIIHKMNNSTSNKQLSFYEMMLLALENNIFNLNDMLTTLPRHFDYIEEEKVESILLGKLPFVDYPF